MPTTGRAGDDFDVVVIGARCAGSPTAMLLAQRSYRVLVLDKHGLTRDVVTGHYIHPPGVAQLDQWGLLDQAVAGCPPITRVSADLGSSRFTVDYAAGWIDVGGRRIPLGPDQRHEFPAYAPRRTVLDPLLCRAAVAAGATYAEHTVAEALLIEDGRVVGVRMSAQDSRGVSGDVRASVVVGADGVHSVVARQTGAAEYDVTPSQTCSYRSYWTGLDCTGLEYYVRQGQSILLMPTHQGLTWVSVGSPIERFPNLRRDVEGGYLAATGLVPEVRSRLAKAKRAERIVGMAVPPTYYRRPYGPGWALVGDAGYHKDPSAGHGITDAFRDAGLLADALDCALSGRSTYDAALAGYEDARNAASARAHTLTHRLAQRRTADDDPLALFAGFGRRPRPGAGQSDGRLAPGTSSDPAGRPTNAT